MYKLVSRNIKFYREYNRNPKNLKEKLTQLKRAEETDISRSLLSSIESENYYIEYSLAVISRCSKVCCIPLNWYFLEEPPKEFYSNKKI